MPKRVYAPRRTGWKRRKYGPSIRRHRAKYKSSRSHRKAGNYQMSGIRIKGFGPPKKLRVKMRFQENWAETTAGGFAQYYWRGNGMNDPDVALGGGFPAGFVSWSQLYKDYRVIGSSIHVEVINNDLNDPLRFSVWPSVDQQPVAVVDADGTAGIPGGSHGIALNQTGRGTCYNRATTTGVYGIKSCDDIGFKSANTTNPAHQWYWNTVFYNRSNEAFDAEINVSIVFDCVLCDAKYSEFANVH